MTKTCAQCKESKPLEDGFYRSKRNKDGRDSYCKDCRNGRHAAFVVQQRESRPPAVPITHRTCSVCGETKPVSEFYSRAEKRNKPVKCKRCKLDEHEAYVQRPEVAARLAEQRRNRASGKWKRPPRREPHAPGYEVCTMCNEDKPLDQFHDHPLGRNGKDSNCKECKRVRDLVRNEDAEVRERNHRLQTMRRFSLAEGEYDAMLERQRGACALCEKPPGRKRLHVDHDHACCPGDTSCGKCVRALLCYSCNAALGLFGDDTELMLRAVAYIEAHRVPSTVTDGD